jgi:hypothetical protein
MVRTYEKLVRLYPGDTRFAYGREFIADFERGHLAARQRGRLSLLRCTPTTRSVDARGRISASFARRIWESRSGSRPPLRPKSYALGARRDSLSRRFTLPSRSLPRRRCTMRGERRRDERQRDTSVRKENAAFLRWSVPNDGGVTPLPGFHIAVQDRVGGTVDVLFGR